MRYRMKRWFPDAKAEKRVMAPKGERGMTLIEAAAGMFVLSLVILGVVGWMGAWSQSSRILERDVQLHAEGDTALRILREDFRSASTVVAVGSRLEFQNVDGKQIRYYRSGRGNLIRTLNNGGASVVASGVTKWHSKNDGERGIQVTLALEKSGSKWERETFLAVRRWKYE